MNEYRYATPKMHLKNNQLLHKHLKNQLQQIQRLPDQLQDPVQTTGQRHRDHAAKYQYYDPLHGGAAARRSTHKAKNHYKLNIIGC